MLPVGTLLQGRYVIGGQVGQGGMGVVYRATDNRLGHLPVAVKEMDASQVAPADRQWTIDAFRQEAQMLARLNHPGIARVMDYFSQGDYSYLVMEFVEGETLEAALKRAPRGFDQGQALAWAGQLAVVLDYLHHQNPPIIFRDLKPGNIMVEPNGTLKLIDFGIARLFKPGQAHDTLRLGTPGYAAPEQYGHGQTDARTDVYTLGIVVHQLLTGHDPALTPMHLPPLRQLRPDLPAQTEAAVAQAVQPNPGLRYASTMAFARALGAPISGPLAAQNVAAVTGRPVVDNFGPAREPAPGGTPGWLKVLVAGLVVVALLLLGWVVVRNFTDDDENAGVATAGVEFVTQVVTPTPEGGTAVVEAGATADGGTLPPDKTPTPESGGEADTVAARETELAGTVAALSVRETEVAATATGAVLLEQAAIAAAATAAQATRAIEEMSVRMTRAVWDAATATAAAAPVACARSPMGSFGSVWNRDRLGCATNGGNGSVWMAFQAFDGGAMVWREDTDKIYVIYNSGGWARFDDVWLEGDPNYTCGEQSTPPTPERGFGRVWCDHNSVRNGLGNAREKEWGATGATQDFESGTIFLAPNGRTYALYGDNGTWR